MSKVTVDIPDGDYCNEPGHSCIFWKYGGSGSLLPSCKLYHKSPTPERHHFPFMSSVRLPECKQNED